MPRKLASATLVALTACSSSEEDPAVVRLVDHFEHAVVSGSLGQTVAETEPMAWRFSTRAHGVTELRIDGERLTGRSSLDRPIVFIETLGETEENDLLHHVEIELSASQGTRFAMRFSETEDVDPGRLPDAGLWPVHASLVPGGELQQYVVAPSRPVYRSTVRYALLSPTDAVDADIRIETVRFVFRREHLAAIPSGVSWQGVGEVYRETIVTRAPERVSFDVSFPMNSRLELALATIEEGPVTFRVDVASPGSPQETTIATKTLTTPHRWEELVVPLDDVPDSNLTLTLSTDAHSEGAIGFWGAPAIRATSADAPGVILFVTDTLRRDRLPSTGTTVTPLRC